MARYRTIKCPHCKNYLKNFEIDTSYPVLGTPMIKCIYCDGLIKTGKKLWRDMSFFEKVGHVLLLSVFIPLYSVIISGALCLAVLYFRSLEFSDANFHTYFLPFFIPVLMVLGYREYKIQKQNISLMENDFDSGDFQIQQY